jgi:hypothetical protein
MADHGRFEGKLLAARGAGVGFFGGVAHTVVLTELGRVLQLEWAVDTLKRHRTPSFFFFLEI